VKVSAHWNNFTIETALKLGTRELIETLPAYVWLFLANKNVSI